jgi:hypothetical protein
MPGIVWVRNRLAQSDFLDGIETGRFAPAIITRRYLKTQHCFCYVMVQLPALKKCGNRFTKGYGLLQERNISL